MIYGKNSDWVPINIDWCPQREHTQEIAIRMKIRIVDKQDRLKIKFINNKEKIEHIIYYYLKTKKFYDTNFRQSGKGKFIKYYLSGWVMAYLSRDKDDIHRVAGKQGKYKFCTSLHKNDTKLRIIFHNKTETYFLQIKDLWNKKWCVEPLIPLKFK